MESIGDVVSIVFVSCIFMAFIVVLCVTPVFDESPSLGYESDDDDGMRNIADASLTADMMNNTLDQWLSD